MHYGYKDFAAIGRWVLHINEARHKQWKFNSFQYLTIKFVKQKIIISVFDNFWMMLVGRLLGFSQPWLLFTTLVSESPSRYNMILVHIGDVFIRNIFYRKWKPYLFSLTPDGGDEPTSVDWKMVNRWFLDWQLYTCLDNLWMLRM